MSSRPRVIVFLVASPFELLDLAGPASVFSYPKVNAKPHYVLKILSTNSDTEVQSTAGLAINNSVHFSTYRGPIDTLIAVGGEGSLRRPADDVIRWIRKRASYAHRIASVCTGAFMLAPTGLLDGRRVTTHWRYLDLLAESSQAIADRTRSDFHQGRQGLHDGWGQRRNRPCPVSRRGRPRTNGGSICSS